jgi:hypothetical protein
VQPAPSPIPPSSVVAYGRRIVGVGSYQAKIVLRASRSVTMGLSRWTGSETVISPAIVIPGLTLAAGDQMRVRLQVVGVNPTLVQAKVWKAGTGEPAAWQRTVSDSTAGLQSPGGVGLSVYLSSSSTNIPVVVSLDALSAVVP